MFLFLTVWISIGSIINCQLSTLNSQLYSHPVYVSTTTMDIDAQKRNIDIFIRIFTDDLEIILHHKYDVDGWLGTPAEHSDSRRLLKEYVNERFSIAVNNGEKIVLSTDSISIDNDMMCFFMKGVSKQTIKQIEVNNRLLTDFFEKQSNLVLIGITGQGDKGYILNRKNSTIMLSL